MMVDLDMPSRFDRQTRQRCDVAYRPRAPTPTNARQAEPDQLPPLDPNRVMSSGAQPTQTSSDTLPLRAAARPSQDTLRVAAGLDRDRQGFERRVLQAASPQKLALKQAGQSSPRRFSSPPTAAEASSASRSHTSTKNPHHGTTTVSETCKTVAFPRGSNLADVVKRQEVKKPQHSKTRSEVEAMAVKLDQEAFRNFWPLLDESRDYARISGCRFRSRSFSGVGGPEAADEDPPSRPDADSQQAAARARAAPAVYRFAERLRSGEAALLEEVDKAFRIVMAESVRSAMVATCQLLELWPPTPRPAGISDDDCAFEDVSADIPVIAKRLYNDDKRRHHLAPGNGEFDPMRRRAMMATFIVEFATAAGASLPELSQTYETMLADFKARAMEWEQPNQTTPEGQMPPANWTPSLYEDPSRRGEAVARDTSQMEIEPVPKAENSSMWSAMFAGTALAAVWGTAVDFGATATADCGSRASRQRKNIDL